MNWLNCFCQTWMAQIWRTGLRFYYLNIWNIYTLTSFFQTMNIIWRKLLILLAFGFFTHCHCWFCKTLFFPIGLHVGLSTRKIWQRKLTSCLGDHIKCPQVTKTLSFCITTCLNFVWRPKIPRQPAIFALCAHLDKIGCHSKRKGLPYKMKGCHT